MDNNIKINTYGLIAKGRNKDWYIYIQEDLKGTGGYYILYKKSLEKSTEGYDAWMENFEDVKDCFEEEQWEVRWLN
ncbi:MAG: hypothetical protein BGO14_00920 [Chlamydiales bacterium 38-26]|nr:hypothetical protein [Chlamydiales bacterium]OJV07283.1 MAG: hypothetical protein BGO14_00920 [Chlamydiales bacterium 38-26]